jgi:hypothetical protein
MESFSPEFFTIFPSRRTYHGEAMAISSHNGRIWSNVEKERILLELERKTTSIRKLAGYLQVKRTRIEKLIAKRKSHIAMQENPGRPTRIDAIGQDDLKAAIITAKDNLKPLTKSQVTDKIKNIVVESDIRRGLNGLTSTVHRVTISKILSNVNASFEKGQTMTKARFRERKDTRNFVSMAAMNEVLAKDKPPQLIGNFDATQFVISNKNSELLVTIKNENSNDESEFPLTNVEEVMLNQAVKWMMLCNANGNLADDVFLLSDPDMDKDAFTCDKIVGLSHNTSPTASGWLCFCKTRCGNMKFSPVLHSRIMTSIARDHPSISSGKASFFAEGVVKIARSLGRVINFQIISHGFERIGMYPLNATKCISNCDSATLKEYSHETICHIYSKISELSKCFLDIENGGQITEAQMDAAGIPIVHTYDIRTAPKDQRTQSHQRAVLLTNPASLLRRKAWLTKQELKKSQIATDLQSSTTGIKRKRAPNRPKHIIEEERKLKEQRRNERQIEQLAKYQQP